MKLKLFFIVFLSALSLTVIAQQRDLAFSVAPERTRAMSATNVDNPFVDMGLSVKWRSKNESGLFAYDEAVPRFGSWLPTKEQWEELIQNCDWEWTGNGYKVISRINGNSITLPAEGDRECEGREFGKGSYGIYWSSTPLQIASEAAWNLTFNSDEMKMLNNYSCNGYSVRLVQGK